MSQEKKIRHWISIPITTRCAQRDDEWWRVLSSLKRWEDFGQRRHQKQQLVWVCFIVLWFTQPRHSHSRGAVYANWGIDLGKKEEVDTKNQQANKKPPLRRRRRHSRVLFICARWPFVSLRVCVCVNIFMGLLTRFGNPVNGIFIVYKTFGTNCLFSRPSICLLHPCYMNAKSRVFEKYCLIINSNNNKIIWLLNCKTKWFMKYIFIWIKNWNFLHS